MFVQDFCHHAKPQIIRVPVRKPNMIEYHTRVILVPCGECEWCRNKMRNHWTSRLYAKSKDFISKYPNGMMFFCTFTISNEWFKSHASELEKPLNDDMPNFIYHNDIDELQVTPVAKYIYKKYWKGHFLDMLRAQRGVNLDLEYYTCCEFGDHTERIHFHSILYIKDFQPVWDYINAHKIPIKKPWKVKAKNIPGCQSRLSTLEERAMETLTDYLWNDFDNVTKKRTPIGHTNVNIACAKSFRYITKYVCKLKEDKNYNKIPFHRQSQMLGIDEDAIIKAILERKPYVVIQGINKEYKCSINKYYRKKYAELLGLREEMQEDFLAQNRQIVLQQMALSGNYTDLPCYVRDGLIVDVFNNDVVTCQYVDYVPTRVLSEVRTKKHGKSVSLWHRVPVMQRQNGYCETFINNKPIDYDEFIFKQQPNEEW